MLRQEGIPDLDFEKEGNVEEDVKDHDGQAVQGNPFPWGSENEQKFLSTSSC